ncbi:hypothetical protein MTR67_052186 [Solanum verrucosum]|uniref:Uncharacterized protein n=1 Tax=Solanum verrucosum TaxID=315347 RepID=A0AAF1A0T5_SOLVR|nr:hypothetical protein MTR67_052186 [Solanum verrucosum]
MRAKKIGRILAATGKDLMDEENQGDVTVDLYAAFDMETEAVAERSSKLENSQPLGLLMGFLEVDDWVSAVEFEQIFLVSVVCFLELPLERAGNETLRGSSAGKGLGQSPSGRRFEPQQGHWRHYKPAASPGPRGTNRGGPALKQRDPVGTASRVRKATPGNHVLAEHNLERKKNEASENFGFSYQLSIALERKKNEASKRLPLLAQLLKLKSAIKEVADGDAEYSLLVNLKRLDDLQLSRKISIESLHNDLAETAPRLSSSGKRWRLCGLGHRFNPHTMQSEATLYLKLWNSPGTIFIFLISKRSALFDLLESFLTTKSSEGLHASQLACRDGDVEYSLLVSLKRLDDDLQLSRKISIEILHNDLEKTSPRLSSSEKRWRLCGLGHRLHSIYLKLWNSPGTIFIFLISKRSALFDLLESFLTTKSPEGLRASQLACRDVLFFQNSGGCSGKQPLHHPKSLKLWCTHQIYTMAATSGLGKVMMDALISMLMELRKSYGPEVSGLKRILSMLLEEELSAELSDEDATNLIWLIFASTRKAVLEKIVPASDNKKKYHTKAQKGLLRYADALAVKPRNLPQMGKETFENFRSFDDKVGGLHSIYLKLWNSLGTIFSFFISKRSALFDLLEFFLTTKSPEGLHASQLVCRNSGGFSGKQPLHHPKSYKLWCTHQIYAMAAASGLGKVMMDALISMHMELRKSYGSEVSGLKRILSMLLEDELSAELSDEDATNLIQLLFASTRKAVLEKIVPASVNKKKYHTKAQKGLLRYVDALAVKPRNLPQMGKAASSLVKVMMDPLISMHMELRNFYGPEVSVSAEHSLERKKNEASKRLATLYLKLWNSPGTIFIFLISKRSALFDLLESFLNTKSTKGLRASQLARRIYATAAASSLGNVMMDALISMHMELRKSYGPEVSGISQWIRWEKFELLPRALDTVSGSDMTELGGLLSHRKAGLEKIVPACDNKKKYHTKAQKDGDAEYSLLVNLKATLASSPELEALVYSTDICNGSSSLTWESDDGCPYFHAYGIEKILCI